MPFLVQINVQSSLVPSMRKFIFGLKIMDSNLKLLQLS